VSTNFDGLDGETGVARSAVNDRKSLALGAVRAGNSGDEAMGVNGGDGGEDESKDGKNGEHLDNGFRRV
jgi:hypothetical protein